MNKKESIGTSPRQEVMSEEPRGNIIALALLLAFLWGGNSLAIKIGLQDFPPMALAFLRFVIGLIVIGKLVALPSYTTPIAPRRTSTIAPTYHDFHSSNHHVKYRGRSTRLPLVRRFLLMSIPSLLLCSHIF